MTPIAFRIGPLEIYWYGICMALAFLAGSAMATYLAPRRNLPRDTVGDLLTWGIVGGLVGARLLFVIQNLGSYLDQPLQMLNIREGGLVFYGGFILASLVLVWRAKVKKLPLPGLADVLAVSLPLAHGIGRIGCFLNGCCHGRVYEGCCAVHYAVPDASYFPIQLIEAFANFVLAGVLFALFFRDSFRGRLSAVYLMLYPLARFLIEFGRGDYASLPLGLTPAQWVCFPVFAAGAVLWYRLHPSRRKEPSPK